MEWLDGAEAFFEDCSSKVMVVKNVQGCAEDALDVVLSALLLELPPEDVFDDQKMMKMYEEIAKQDPYRSIHRETSLMILSLVTSASSKVVRREQEVQATIEARMGEDVIIPIPPRISTERITVYPPKLHAVSPSAMVTLEEAVKTLKRCEEAAEVHKMLLCLEGTINEDSTRAGQCMDICLNTDLPALLLAPEAWCGLLSTALHVANVDSRELTDAESSLIIHQFCQIDTCTHYRSLAFIAVKLLNRTTIKWIEHISKAEEHPEVVHALFHLFPTATSTIQISSPPDPPRRSQLVSLCTRLKSWHVVVGEVWRLRRTKGEEQVRAACQLRQMLIRYPMVVPPMLVEVVMRVMVSVGEDEAVLAALPHAQVGCFLR